MRRRPKTALLPAPLSGEERELWAQVDAGIAPAPVTLAVAHRRQQLTADLCTRSYPGTAAMARAVGCTSSQIDHLTASGRLFAVVVAGVAHYPAWQLAGRDPIAHLPAVLARLQAWEQPLLVDAWWTTPVDVLVHQGASVAPATWLRLGGDPAAVLALVVGPAYSPGTATAS